MWECQASIDVEAPIEQVYMRLKDLARHSDFAGGLVSVQQTTPGPVGIGTRFRAEERVPGRYVSHSEITGLDEPRLIAWRAWVDGVMRTEWEFHIAQIENGSRLVQVSRWKPAGPLGFVMLHLHRKRNVPRENAQTLACIKSVLEAEIRAGTLEAPV